MLETMKFAISAFCLVLFSLPSFAEDLLLPPTYQTGKKYVLRNEQQTKITAGNDIQTISLSLDIEVLCERAKGRPGQRVLNTTISRLKADMKLGALAMNYDSEVKGSEKTLLGQTFQNIVAQEFRIFLNEADEVVEVEGLKDLGANNPLAQQFGPKQLTQMVVPQLNLGIPKTGVRKGESWTNQVDGKFGPGTNLKVDYRFDYVGDEPGKESHANLKYEADLAMKLTGGGDETDQRLSLSVEDGRLTGTITIDKDLRFPQGGDTEIAMTMKTPNPQNPAETLELPVKQTIQFRVLSVERIGLLR